MDTRRLKYFVTTINEGSISAAARKLFMAQPPLSLALQALEQEVGAVLFLRGKRGVTLTEAGRLFYIRACAILEDENKAVTEARLAADGSTGILTVGVVSSAIAKYAVPLFCRFRISHPSVRIEIVESDTYRLLDLLHNSKIAAALVRTPFSEDGLVYRKIDSEPIVALTKGKDASPLPLSFLGSKNLIVYRRWEAILREHAQANSIPFSPAFLCDDARTAVLLCEQGAGCAVVPKSAAESVSISDISVREINDLGILSDVCLVYPEKRYISAVAGEFISFCEQYFS